MDNNQLDNKTEEPIISDSISFKYKEEDGKIVEVNNIKPGRLYSINGDLAFDDMYSGKPNDFDSYEFKTYLMKNVVFEKKVQNFEIGDKVRYIPQFKSQKTLEGIVCYIDENRVYFYSGYMPSEFYNTDWAKRSVKDIIINNKMYTWEIMAHPKENLDKISTL